MKCFLSILGAVACSLCGLFFAKYDWAVVFVIGSFILYIAAVVFFFQGIVDLIRTFIQAHRQVRQSIDDERIRKFHEYGKGGKNGL